VFPDPIVEENNQLDLYKAGRFLVVSKTGCSGPKTSFDNKPCCLKKQQSAGQPSMRPKAAKESKNPHNVRTGLLRAGWTNSAYLSAPIYA
jgi:hypothetical protein